MSDGLSPDVRRDHSIDWKVGPAVTPAEGNAPAEGNTPDAGVGADDPWDANVAVPTLLFWRDRLAFRERFRNLSVVIRRRFDLLLYPLSGGFERRRLVPMPLVPLVKGCERLLTPLAPLLAFRCFVVIQKI